MEIKLRLKYRTYNEKQRVGNRSHTDNSGKKKNKRNLTDEEKALHVRQPKKVMVLANGKCRMRIVEE